MRRGLFTKEHLFYLFLTALLVPLLLFLIPEEFDLRKRAEASMCETKRVITDLKVSGVVIAKYKAMNKFEQIEYFNGKDTIENRMFVWEGSHAFDSLQVGDTIRKDAGSLLLVIRKKGSGIYPYVEVWLRVNTTRATNKGYRQWKQCDLNSKIYL
jgi:hypothetical protein